MVIDQNAEEAFRQVRDLPRIEVAKPSQVALSSLGEMAWTRQKNQTTISQPGTFSPRVEATLSSKTQRLGVEDQIIKVRCLLDHGPISA